MSFWDWGFALHSAHLCATVWFVNLGCFFADLIDCFRSIELFTWNNKGRHLLSTGVPSTLKTSSRSLNWQNGSNGYNVITFSKWRNESPWKWDGLFNLESHKVAKMGVTLRVLTLSSHFELHVIITGTSTSFRSTASQRENRLVGRFPGAVGGKWWAFRICYVGRNLDGNWKDS